LYNITEESSKPLKGIVVFSPIAQTPMLYEPAYETMVVGLFSCLALLILFLQLDKSERLVYAKTLVQEGIDEQIGILLLHM